MGGHLRRADSCGQRAAVMGGARSFIKARVRSCLEPSIFTERYGQLLTTSHAVDRPNILYIMSDDMGYNDVSWYNPEVMSPNMHRLVDDGVTLNKAYAQVACTPSRAAYLTGYYPFRIGVQSSVVREGIEDYVPLDITFLPKRLKEAGYSTHLVGKWHLGHCRRDATPTGRGFDTFLGVYTGYNNYYTKKIQMISSQDEFDPNAPGTVYDFFNNTTIYPSAETDYTTDIFTNRTQDLIRQHKSEPFFIALHYTAPHWPLQAPQEYLDKYAHITDKDRRTYLAMVTSMDDGIGQIMKTLEDENVLDNTIVMFISDNGGAPQFAGDNTPFRGKKTMLYEGGVRVPAFVYSPSILTNTPRVSEDIFHIVDWFSTILQIAGLEAGNVDSVSQWDMLRYGVAGPRRSFIYNIFEDNAAIRAGRYKLIEGDPELFEARRRKRRSAEAHSSPHSRQKESCPRRPEESDMQKVMKAFNGLVGLRDINDVRKQGGWTVDRIMNLLDSYGPRDSAVLLCDCFDCQLYDLEADPGETTDLVKELPAVTLFLHDLLQLYKVEEVNSVLQFPYVQDPRYTATLPHDSVDNTWCEADH
ncbi:hypothetical protein ACOMHN_012214 [Nucella lapillus]